jgi:hypothetical protein
MPCTHAQHPSRVFGSGPTGAIARVAFLATLALSCTHGAKARFEGTRPAAVLVEVLPPGAEVTLDGAPLGPGSRVAPAAVKDGAAHVIAASAPGFEPDEWRGPAGGLAGVRVGLALRPQGLPGKVELDDAATLVRAADFLAANGRPADAQAYAARAASLAPDLAVAQRSLGAAALAAGDHHTAERSLAAYLRLAPDAPDAGEIEAVLARLEEER